VRKIWSEGQRERFELVDRETTCAAIDDNLAIHAVLSIPEPSL
jgi:hypothetical protein